MYMIFRMMLANDKCRVENIKYSALYHMYNIITKILKSLKSYYSRSPKAILQFLMCLYAIFYYFLPLNINMKSTHITYININVHIHHMQRHNERVRAFMRKSVLCLYIFP